MNHLIAVNLKKYTKWLALLSFFGALVSLYLTYLHFSPEASGICQLGPAFDCDKVNKSMYSELFGIPVAILGAGYYIGMFVFSLLFSYKTKLFAKVDLKDLFRGLLLITLIGIAFTLYLTYQEAFTIKSYCIFCVIQQIIILIMGGIVLAAYRQALRLA